MRFLSPMRRRRCSTSRSKVRMEGLWGLRTLSWSRWQRSNFRIGCIGLGMTRSEGLAVFRQRCRIDGKQDQKIIFLQRIDERALGDLQAHRNGPALKSLSERACPLLDGIGAMGED